MAGGHTVLCDVAVAGDSGRQFAIALGGTALVMALEGCRTS